MDSIELRGGIALQGKVRIQGSKNAALPIMAAALFTEGQCKLTNCPNIADVCAMVKILRGLGCKVIRCADGILMDATDAAPGRMDTGSVTGMRSSLCMLGAMLGRFGEVVMEYPGGCVIGARPIDIHLNALTEFGVCFTKEGPFLHGVARHLVGTDIVLPSPSVGATENVILAAVMAEGTTRIQGAAVEPEVQALCDFLAACGADIRGAGTGCVIIEGGKKLSGCAYRIPADRIVAGTYLFGCIGTGGSVLLEEAPVGELTEVLRIGRCMGAEFLPSSDGLFVQGPKRPTAPGMVRTKVYPGFPTDLQSALLAVATISDGETVIEENIFENRFRIVDEFKKMGADITRLNERSVRIKGVDRLCGSRLSAKELRGGAALVLGGLMAGGYTNVSGCSYIYRGYENICRDLRELGARISSV